MRGWRLAASLAALVTFSGCSSAHDDDVREAAESFHAALQAKDGPAACAQVSDDVRK
jgi:hypothetical protein